MYPANLYPTAKSDFDGETEFNKEIIRESKLHNIRRVYLGTAYPVWAGQPTFKDCAGFEHLSKYVRII